MGIWHPLCARRLPLRDLLILCLGRPIRYCFLLCGATLRKGPIRRNLTKPLLRRRPRPPGCTWHLKPGGARIAWTTLSDGKPTPRTPCSQTPHCSDCRGGCQRKTAPPPGHARLGGEGAPGPSGRAHDPRPAGQGVRGASPHAAPRTVTDLSPTRHRRYTNA